MDTLTGKKKCVIVHATHNTIPLKSRLTATLKQFFNEQFHLYLYSLLAINNSTP